MSVNYKETLNLPKTDFPMKADLVKREPVRLQKWQETQIYQKIQAARAEAPLFVLHDGPPFANGDVHMGTALNKVLKDIIVKSRTMLGWKAPFVPGWDCHGLPIEFKVVKESRGLTPVEVRRRSEEHARKYIGIMGEQFQRLGVFGDWENPYRTMDPGYEAEIIRAFGQFVDKDLVYRSKKPVYWSTGAQTALAEAEVEYADRVDPAIYVKFPVVSGKLAGEANMVIWTTTPWTLPANVAIAVHPREEYALLALGREGWVERFVVARPLIQAFLAETELQLIEEIQSYKGAELAGMEAQHPFLGRTSRVITAEFVTMDTGTGQVHIAPGHGSDDYIAGLEHKLPILSPVDDQGRMTDEAGMPEWVGKYVFDVNADVVNHLRGAKVLLGEKKHQHSYPHCWRSKTPVVFRAVEQFFIRVDAIRGKALEAIDGVKWIPGWGRNRIYGTVESRPDWCISRQRTWGVPLPVFYAADGKPLLDGALVRRVADLIEQHGTNLWFEKDDAWWASALELPEGTTRRNDTLDVWIDSGVSHQAVCRKNPALAWPADVYIEATDQHRGWFQSSLMTSVAMNDAAPYRMVITHGFVVDKDTRKKISKSAQGTYTKPMNASHFVEKYGADVVRLWAASVEFTNEVPFSEESFSVLTDAYRQFRNILRILLANVAGYTDANAPAPEALTIVDRWILSKLHTVTVECRQAYDAYDFRKVFQVLNQFCTVELSALYVDFTKDRLYCDAVDSPRRRATQYAMKQVFDALCKLLAPVLAFTADEAWEYSGRATTVHLEDFPNPETFPHDPETEAFVDELLRLRGVIAQAVEKARQEKVIGNALEATITLQVSDATLLEKLKPVAGELEEFFILSELVLTGGPETVATLVRTDAQKCDRCWRYKRTVGLTVAHPTLCDRCAEVVLATTAPENA